MTIESIKSKIAALLAKAEKTDNPHEADAFMAKVLELLERHQIEMHEIRSHDRNLDSDPVVVEKGETSLYASMGWARNLAGALARLYGCKFIYWRKGNHFTYELIGRKSACLTTELMLPYVISQVKQHARKLSVGSYNAQSESVMAREVGSALMVRIDRMVASADAHRVVLTGKGLIPVSDLDSFLKARHPEIKTAKGRKLSFGKDAWDVAQKINVNQQTGQEKREAIR